MQGELQVRARLRLRLRTVLVGEALPVGCGYRLQLRGVDVHALLQGDARGNLVETQRADVLVEAVVRVQVEAQGIAGIGSERKLAGLRLVGDGEPRERRHGDGHQREQHQHHRSGQATTQVLLPFFAHLHLLPIKHGEQVHV